MFFRGDNLVGRVVADEAVVGVLLKNPCSVFWLLSPVDPAFFKVGTWPEGVEATPVFFLAIIAGEQLERYLQQAAKLCWRTL